MAALLGGDEAGAAAALRDLIQFRASLPEGFPGTWNFTGTLKYLRDQAGLDTERRKFLLHLIDFSQGKADQAALEGCTPPSLRQV